MNDFSGLEKVEKVLITSHFERQSLRKIACKLII